VDLVPFLEGVEVFDAVACCLFEVMLGQFGSDSQLVV
jgi:hypothetical protein